MSINIKTDPLRSAILFDRPVLFTSQRIPREEVPEGWYYYELRGSVRNAKKTRRTIRPRPCKSHRLRPFPCSPETG